MYVLDLRFFTGFVNLFNFPLCLKKYLSHLHLRLFLATEFVDTPKYKGRFLSALALKISRTFKIFQLCCCN